jgi:hypothetical protein
MPQRLFTKYDQLKLPNPPLQSKRKLLNQIVKLKIPMKRKMMKLPRKHMLRC